MPEASSCERRAPRTPRHDHPHRSAQILDQQFAEPRPGYNLADRRMARVACALPAAGVVHEDAGVALDHADHAAPDDVTPDAIEPDDGMAIDRAAPPDGSR